MSDKKTLADVYKTMNSEQQVVVDYLVGLIVEDTLKQSDMDTIENFLMHQGVEPDGQSLGDIVETFTPIQMKAVRYMVGRALSVEETGE